MDKLIFKQDRDILEVSESSEGNVEFAVAGDVYMDTANLKLHDVEVLIQWLQKWVSEQKTS